MKGINEKKFCKLLKILNKECPDGRLPLNLEETEGFPFTLKKKDYLIYIKYLPGQNKYIITYWKKEEKN